MSIVEIYKPSFEKFHEKPVIVFQEPKGQVRIVVNLLEQYTNWLNAWTDPFRDKHAPAAAFWETPGPAICRALRMLPACVGLFFDWETDRKVAYRWISRTPESPVRYKTDYYTICSVKAECNSRNSEGRVTVTLPTDEDVSFYFHASTMKEWLRPQPSEERATNACTVCGEHHKLEPLKPKSRVKTKVARVEVGHDYNRSVPMGAIGMIKEWSQYGIGSPVSVRVEFDLKDKHGDALRHSYMPCELEILTEEKP